nr:hypothetical protein Itr_chr14CG09120 [Ipomoea trifida]
MGCLCPSTSKLFTGLLDEPMKSADFLDGEMILNDDTAVARDYYEQLDDLMLQPFPSTGHGNVGMSQ